MQTKVKVLFKPLSTSAVIIKDTTFHQIIKHISKMPLQSSLICYFLVNNNLGEKQLNYELIFKMPDLMFCASLKIN